MAIPRLKNSSIDANEKEALRTEIVVFIGENSLLLLKYGHLAFKSLLLSLILLLAIVCGDDTPSSGKGGSLNSNNGNDTTTTPTPTILTSARSIHSSNSP